jgi:hypothetical protein
MSETINVDESLVQGLPLPLAKLVRRVQNAKTPLDRHQAAYYLWEAGLKLLASVAVVEYSELGEHDPNLVEPPAHPGRRAARREAGRAASGRILLPYSHYI